MTLPTEIQNMNSLAAAWEDGVDAINTSIRPAVDDWVADDAEVFGTGQFNNAAHLTNERSHVFFLYLTGLQGDHQYGSYADGDAVRILSGSVYIIPASDDGSEPLLSVGDTSTIPINEWFILTVVIEDNGGNGIVRVNWSGRGASLDLTPSEPILNPPDNSRLAMSRRIGSGDNQYCSLYVRYSDKLTDAEESDIIASVALPAGNVDAILFNSYGTVKDFGPNNYGSYSHAHAIGIGETNGLWDRNEFGWSTEDVSGLAIPHKAGGVPFTDGLHALTTTTVYNDAAAIDLASYKIPERYKRFVAADDSGFFNIGAPLVDVDGTLYGTASKSTVDSPLPYQQTYAKNLISYDDDGVITTVLLDKNHVDYAADLPALEALAGVGQVTAKFPNLPEGALVIIMESDDLTVHDYAVVPAGGLSYAYQWTADTDYKCRVFAEGYDPLYMNVTHTEGGVTRADTLKADPFWPAFSDQEGGISGVDVTEIAVGGTMQWLEFDAPTTLARAHLWVSVARASSVAYASSHFCAEGHWRTSNGVQFASSANILIKNTSGAHMLWSGGQFTLDSGNDWLHPDTAHFIRSTGDIVYPYAGGFGTDDRTLLEAALKTDEWVEGRNAP